MAHTPTTTIPRCWQRSGQPDYGFHAWGSIGDCCKSWWVARSEQDRRTRRPCADTADHAPHLWLWSDLAPPQPYTMWMCGGTDERTE